MDTPRPCTNHGGGCFGDRVVASLTSQASYAAILANQRISDK